MIKLGYIHFKIEYHYDSPYAYVSRRMGWRFWRWEIAAIFLNDEEVIVATNLTKLGAIGMLKLLGVKK